MPRKRKRKIPSKPRFKEARKKGYEFLIELGIKKFPVDPFEIIEGNSENWSLLSYSECKEITGEKDPLNLKRDKAEAKTMTKRGSNKYLIVYDDSYQRERIRWTLAHEIGHIILGHLVHYEETALSRGGLNEKQYRVLELEAHWFAEALLSPIHILDNFDIKNVQQIAFLCDISKDASTKSLKHINNNYSNDAIVERKLLRNFYDFFYKDKHLQVTFENLAKYKNSYLYSNLSKICKICSICNSFITISEQNYCHICGKKVPDDFYPYIQTVDPNTLITSLELMQGQHYHTVDTDNLNHVTYCPICKNHHFSRGSSYCKICGSPTMNYCLNENSLLSGGDKYCPKCGSLSSFGYHKVIDNIKEIEIPDLLSYSNGIYEDYIEYEHWNYIIAKMQNHNGNPELFSALEHTKVIRDDDTFVIFISDKFAEDIINKNNGRILKYISHYGFTLATEMRCNYVI